MKSLKMNMGIKNIYREAPSENIDKSFVQKSIKYLDGL